MGCSPLVDDLVSVGMEVIGSVESRSKIVQDVVRCAPDVVIFHDANPAESLFSTVEVIGHIAPCPIIVFTADSDADKIEKATRVGVHAYVINGYGINRLRSLIHLAQSRFRQAQLLHGELTDMSNRFEERKLLDRAKGILMRARQISEQEAFQILRTASQHLNQRMGDISRQVINASLFAESVNRAGQLRMLSQRLIKLYFLRLANINPQKYGQLLSDSISRTDTNIAVLSKTLSKSTFGDFIESITKSWSALRHAMLNPPPINQYIELDTLAEKLLDDAEKLTSGLENAGTGTPLHVINVAGRQRMLSQRFAKYALLMLLGGDEAQRRAESGLNETKAAFEQALIYLNDIPLSTTAIRDALTTGTVLWQQMVSNAQAIQDANGKESIAITSEHLLDCFERLTEQYERSMQTLVG